MPSSIDPVSISVVPAGRPTREQARARHEALLDCAFEHFLDRGFEQATIEAIAADMNMTKRTVYARYPGKAELFLAALRRGIESYAPPPERIAATLADDLEQSLVNLARLRIELIRTPQGLKLQRIINTEAYRHPEIFTLYYELAARPTVDFLADLLRAEADAGRLAIEEPVLAANVFMSMVVGGPVRFINSGNPLEEDTLDARIMFAVRLFLDGARSR